MEEKSKNTMLILSFIILLLVGIGCGWYIGVTFANKENTNNKETINDNKNEDGGVEENGGIIDDTNIQASDNGIDNNIQESNKHYESTKTLNDKYLTAYYTVETEIGETGVIDILDKETNKVVKTLNYWGISEQSFGNNKYYIADNSPMDSNYVILDSNFNPLIKEYSSYAYDINTDNTIILIPYRDNEYYPIVFAVYDFKGNKIYESKKYTEVIVVGKDFVIANDNGSIDVINKNGTVKKHIMTLEGDWFSSQTDNARNCYNDGSCEIIYLFKNDESHNIQYNWKTNAFEIDKF